MSKFTKCQKDNSIRYMILGTICGLGFIWLNTFMRQNSFDSSIGAFSLLRTFLVGIGCTSFVYVLFSNAVYEGTETISGNIKACCALSAAIGALLCMELVLEAGTFDLSLFGEGKEQVRLFLPYIKFIYDFWAIIIFPLNIQMLFKAMKKQHFCFGAIVTGSIGVIILTVEGHFIFENLGNNWLVDLAVMNTITLATAVWKYAFSEKKIRKGNAFSSVIFYVLFRIGLLVNPWSRCDGTITGFMYPANWSEYMAGVKELVQNAAIFGTSKELMNSDFIREWLYRNNKLVLQLLFYGGWAAVAAFVLFAVFFVCIVIKMIGTYNGRNHKNYLIFVAAASVLIIRSVLGILYNFGFPYPVTLPFCGSSGIITDSMAFSLLLWSACENRFINDYKKIEETFVSVEDVLEPMDEYRVLDRDGFEYEEDFLYSKEEKLLKDVVDIIGVERKVHCSADWYSIDERDFCVFTEKNSDGRRFILEYLGDRWIPLSNSEEEIQRQLIEDCVTYNKPDCVEDMDDEREDYEN